MIGQIEISDVARETLVVLKYLDVNFVSKIPDDFINELKKLAKKSTLTVKIDKDKKLKEQDISEETKDLISLIYYTYIATNEEKEEIEKIWNQNEELYQNIIREKYNTDNIFKKNVIKDSKQETLNLPSIVQKENFIKKIINVLKKMICIK